MDRDDAIQFALSRRPESIGMARLCQELLAEVAGKPVTARTPVVVNVCSSRGRSPEPVVIFISPFERAGRPR